MRFTIVKNGLSFQDRLFLLARFISFYMNEGKSSHGSDVFLCSANSELGNWLFHRLEELGYAVWFEPYSLALGDSKLDTIQNALGQSRFGLVMINEELLMEGKGLMWLKLLFELETRSSKRILPIVDGIPFEDVHAKFPFFRDRVMLSSEIGRERLVARIISVLEKSN